MCVGGIIGKGIGVVDPRHVREVKYDKISILNIQERLKEDPGERRNWYCGGSRDRRIHESGEFFDKRLHEVIP